MSTLFRMKRHAWLFLAFFIVGCGGRAVKVEIDPYALLKEGRYAEARAAMVAKGGKTPKDRGLVALSFIAEDPTAAKAKEAIAALTEGTDGAGAAIAALEMLNLIPDIPQPVLPDVSFWTIDAAVGTTGRGPLAPSTGTPLPVSEQTRNIAWSVLERLYLTLLPTDVSIQSNRLISIWNSCFVLCSGSFEIADDVQAWSLFQSVGGLAVMMSQTDINVDVANRLLDSAVTVLENNPQIAIAARCDLGSPFDDLRLALAHKRKLLSRLELAVAVATGCTRGTYAPEAP